MIESYQYGFDAGLTTELKMYCKTEGVLPQFILQSVSQRKRCKKPRNPWGSLKKLFQRIKIKHPSVSRRGGRIGNID